MATLSYQITATHRGDANAFQVIPVAVVLTVGNAVSADRLAVLHAAPVSVPLGNVTTPRFAYLSNVDADNYVKVLNDAVEIGRIPAGTSSFIALPDGVVLKLQANVATVNVDFAVFEAA